MNGINQIRTTPYAPQTKNAAVVKQFPSTEAVTGSAVQAKKAQQDDQEPVLTNNEQNFFEQLYPDSTQEIRSYQTYRRDGERMMASMGSLVDRKG